MSFKLETIGSSLVITDTVGGAIISENPRRDMFFMSSRLTDAVPTVVIYDTNGTAKKASTIFEAPLSECVNSLSVAFTDATFRTFARAELGLA